MREILRVVDKDIIPDRWAVNDDFIQAKLNPEASRQDWRCLYCSMQDVCRKVGPGEVSIKEVVL